MCNLVTRGHFRSRDEDGGHTIRSAVVKNPMLHATLVSRDSMPMSVIEAELWAIEVLHCWNRNFGPFWHDLSKFGVVPCTQLIELLVHQGLKNLFSHQ